MLATSQSAGTGGAATGSATRAGGLACGQRAHGVDLAVQVVRRVVRSEVGAVAEDAAVLHETVRKKDLLAGDNVVPREERLTRRRDDLGRHRWLVPVVEVACQPQPEEPEDEDQYGDLD